MSTQEQQTTLTAAEQEAQSKGWVRGQDSGQGINPATTALGLTKRVQELDAAIKQFSELATVEEYTQVGEYGVKAAAVVKEAEAFYEDETSRLYQLWKDKVAEREAIVKPAKNVKDLAGQLCGAWQRKKEDERRAEELRLEAEAREEAETATLNEAAELEKQGRTEEAEALIESPIETAPVMVRSSVPRVNGVSKPRDNFKAEVTSLILLVKAVAEGKVPLNAVQADDSFLNNQARAMKGVLNYPGVKVTNKPKSAFGR